MLLTQVRPRPRSAPVAPPRRRATVRAEVRDGFHEVRSRTWVWATLSAFCVALFAGLAPWFVLGPVVARQQYGSIALFDVWWETALAERIPPELLSRVSSYDWMISLGLLPVGFLAAGPLAAVFGSVEILLAGSIVALLAYLAGLAPRATRMLERRPGLAG